MSFIHLIAFIKKNAARFLHISNRMAFIIRRYVEKIRDVAS